MERMIVEQDHMIIIIIIRIMIRILIFIIFESFT
jgi:hypothetical protein